MTSRYQTIDNDVDHDTAVEDNTQQEPMRKYKDETVILSTYDIDNVDSENMPIKIVDTDELKCGEEALNTTHFSAVFANTGEIYREWKTYEGLVEKRIQELATANPEKHLLQEIVNLDEIINMNQRSLQQIKLINSSKKAWQNKMNWYPQKQLYPLLEDISNIYRDSGNTPHISYVPSLKLSASKEVDDDVERINLKFNRGWNKPTINRIKSTMFDRECTKYWVKNENMIKVIGAIIPYLPIYRHPLSKDPSVAQKISSVYFDDGDCKCYHERINKEHDARAVRIRWYGEDKSVSFIERKIHKKCGEQSMKERFRMKQSKMIAYINGEDVFDTGINKGMAMKRLQEEVSEMIQIFGLKPKTRVVYNRISFQMDTTNAIRISLDTDLRFIKENKDLLDNDMWFTEDEMITKENVTGFPFNVLELKLCGKYIDETPDWIKDLMQSDLLMDCYKFSKYAQSIHSFFSNDIYITPRWIEQYPQYFDEEFKDSKAVGDDECQESVTENRRYICCKRCGKDREEQKGKNKELMNPKLFFANERTFLKWFNVAVFVSSAGLTILSMNPSDISGPLLLAVSIFVLLWSVGFYYWRNWKLSQNAKTGLHDFYGPFIMTSVVIVVGGICLKNGVAM